MSTLTLLVYMFIILGLINSVMKKTRKNVENREKGVRSRSTAAKSYTQMRSILGSGSNTRARSTDGHVLSKDQDITCRKYGHRHSRREEPEMRFLVHDDPEQGYILLNGVKMRITEADQYENRI